MTRWRPIASTVVCLVGLGLAAFLTYGHYFDQAAISQSCKTLDGGSGFVNCGLVTTSPQSMIFGIPVALYGLVFFVVMLGLCLPVAWRSRSALLAWGRLALNVVGIGFVLYLVGVEFLQLHHLCVYCSCVHLLQFVLFLIVATGWYDTGYAWAGHEDEEEARAGAKGSLVA